MMSASSVLLQLAPDDEHPLAVLRRADLLDAGHALEAGRGAALGEDDVHLEAVADLVGSGADSESGDTAERSDTT